MATMTIRKINEQVKTKLRIQAASHGVSMEEEIRRILADSVAACESSESTFTAPCESSGKQPHPLDGYAGTWIEDPGTEAALEAFAEIDEEQWK